jgi:PAS domain S-box-containing protein
MDEFFFIVDDNPQLSFKLNNIIKTNLAKTIVIEKFEDLFGKLLNLKPNLILIHKEVLDENNFRLIRKLKEISGYKPIVVVYAAEPILEKSQVSLMKVGVDGFIHNLDNPHWIVLYLKSLIGIRDTEKKDEDSEQKYRMLFETMFSAYALHEIIVDDNNQPINYRFLEVNPAFERITGLKASKVVGKKVLDIFPATNPRTIQTYGEVALLGERLQFEQFSTEHQKYFEVVAFSPQKGQFSTIFVDITQYKEALRLVQNSENELKEINATKDKFFSIVAHDLKNPFQGILGFVELLHNNLEEFEEDELKLVIEQIKDATESAYNLVLNLLEWSRLQLNRISFNPIIIDLHKLASREISTLKAQANSKNIAIVLDLPEDSGVFADENMIGMVLRNLISNAIKFTNVDGEIIIQLNFMPKFMDIEIKDNGVGISQENIKKLFKVNQQVVNQGTAKEKGTGLGLILCKEFIEKNKGKIWVESKLGTGSSFHVLLPETETQLAK